MSENKKNKEVKLTVKNNYDITSAQSLVSLAKTLRQHIVEYKLYTAIKNKNYVHVEGWQFAGALLGLRPVLVDLTRLPDAKDKIKYSAKVEIINRDGTLMGVGIAICSNEEDKKKSFDEYAVASMAQTRAIGKAYRNLIGWVINMSGYEATPAEEMGQHAENEDKRDSKIETVLNTIASVRTMSVLDHVKSDLRKEAKDKKFTKEENAKIKEALDKKENELSVSST